ncbi:MAG: ATP-binding cassette domain-containing protein [Candidatus Zixiibacteriota bacterium]
MIKFEKVSFAYPGSPDILKDINLTISEGERIALVGGNGSGKTTLALMINGILKAESGRVTVAGLDPSIPGDSLKLKQKVGLVFQNPDNQLVSTTVETEVAFSLENANIDPATMHHQVESILDFFNLLKSKAKLTSNLSGGEKQKLALVAVMIAEPDILILDEPGSYLDETGKKLLDQAIEQLIDKKPNLTVIRITQYALIAAQYPRIVVCHEGSIIADGPPEEIFRMNPKNIGIAVPIDYQLLNGIKIKSDRDNSISGNKATSQTIKSIKAVSISFGYHNGQNSLIFKNQNLELTNDKIYGLVGLSGTGKTTLLQLLANLLKLQSGNIERYNFNHNDLVSVVFQQPERQFFKETVDEEIRFGPENLRLNNIDQIVANSYQQVGLDRDKYAHRNSFTLSGGEKRRLAFASIISLNPAFVFFDEPTCALDNDGIIKFSQMIKALNSEGLGVVIVSHFGEIIFELSDEIILIDKGTINRPITKKEFFLNHKYDHFLSVPEVVSYQLDKFGEMRYFSKDDLLMSVD